MYKPNIPKGISVTSNQDLFVCWIINPYFTLGKIRRQLDLQQEPFAPLYNNNNHNPLTRTHAQTVQS